MKVIFMAAKNSFLYTFCRMICALGIMLAMTAHAAPVDRHCLSECTTRIGIISAFGAEADILVEQTQNKRSWNINGNHFTTGQLRGNQVVIVLSGISMVNAAMVTQLMLDHFRIERLLMSGIAGGVNPNNYVGDVIAAQRWALPMETYWHRDGNPPCNKGDSNCVGLQIATENGKVRPAFKFNTPAGPLSSGLFMRDTFVQNASNGAQGEFRFDFEADPAMLAIVRALKPDLARCGPLNPSRCVHTQPVLRVGGRAVSIPTFLANADYRAYLYESLQAQAVDMETAAFAQVAYANGVPFLAFRSLSDLAGGDTGDIGEFFGSGLAEANAAKVTLAFLEAWANMQRPMFKQ